MSGPQHSRDPITITVDHPDRPSQTIEGKQGQQDGWLAILDANDGTGKIEAISIGGPGAAVSTALTVLSLRKRRQH